jgi:hypothetical protein
MMGKELRMSWKCFQWVTYAFYHSWPSKQVKGGSILLLRKGAWQQHVLIGEGQKDSMPSWGRTISSRLAWRREIWNVGTHLPTPYSIRS